MTTTIRGVKEWSMSRDDEGHREYKMQTLVQSTSASDGPAYAITTPGLPLVGSPWILGNDVDLWAWCRWSTEVTPVITGEPNYFWLVEQTFSTKPLPRDQQRPNDTPIENPLMEPPKISGSYIKVSEEATHDRFGYPIVSSSWEMLRGPQVEFDVTRSTVKIEQNFATLNFLLNEAYLNCVNDSPLWLQPARCIKLSGISWERKFHGQGLMYYSRTLDFEINRNGWDRTLLDEGTKVLHGHWDKTTGAWVLDNINGEAPNPANPTHFIRFKDKNGENTSVVLNGRGLPSSSMILSPTNLDVVGKLYISITNSNIGNALTNETNWLQQSRLGLESQWLTTRTYPKGSLAFTSGSFYIALQENTNQIPAFAPSYWQLLPDGVTDRGDYSASKTYSVGHRVTYPFPQPTAVGSVFVSKYPSVNFLNLTVPVIY